jgi:hypothetical protein
MENTRSPIGAPSRTSWISLLLLAALSTWAAPRSAIITLTMPLGARQMGMGEAGVALPEDAFASWWNPAGLAFGPVADEWSLSQSHPASGAFRALTSKGRRGFLSSSELWAGADGGLQHLKDGRWRDWWSVEFEEGQSLRTVVRRFIGTEDGLDSLLPQVRRFNGVANAEEEELLVEVRLPWSLVLKDSVTAVHYEERTDKLWVGTVRGLWRFDGSGWKKFTQELGERRINAFASQGSTIWVATDDGLFRYKESIFLRKGTVFKAGQKFSCLTWSEDRGELYVGVAGQGLARLAPAKAEGQADKWSLFTGEDGLMDLFPLSVVADSYGHVWVAHRGGLSHFNQLRWEQIRFEGNRLNSLAIEPDGSLWIATDLGAWQHVPYHSTEAGRKSAKELTAQEKEQLGTWRHFHEGTGLTSSVVQSIEPRDDDVWFITKAGVERFHRARSQVAMFYENLLPRFGIPNLYHLGAASTFPLREWGTVGGFINFVSFGETTIAGEAGQSDQKFNSTEMVAGVSYGTRLTRRQALGVSFQFIYSDLSSGVAGQADARTASYALSAGWLMRDLLIPRFNVAAVLANMGPQVYYVDKSQSDPIPLTWRLGVSYVPLETADHRVALVADYNREAISMNGDGADPFHVALWRSWIRPESADPGASVGERLSAAFREGTVNAGAEYTYSNTLALRLGGLYDYPFAGSANGRKELDLGVGLMLSDVLQLDFAMIKELNANDARDGQGRLSMIFRF